MTIEQTKRVVELLADGHFHSGEELGEQLNISRSAIWKLVKSLEKKQINIECVHGKGYRLPTNLQFYKREEILKHLSNQQRQILNNLDIFTSIASTNRYLIEKLKDNAESASFCIAEEQTAGRGRCGREWVSPFAKNIYLSLLWRFDDGPSALTGLTLVIGIAIINVLRQAGGTALKLKWPNDIYWNQKKLAGVLTEMSIDSIGVCHAIIGIGINLELSSEQLQQEYPWVDCKTIIGNVPDKNQLAGLLINELLTILPHFEQYGWSYYKGQWEQYDYLYDQEVMIKIANKEIYGIAKGVDNKGGLRIQNNNEIKSFNAGEVKVRKVEK